MSELTATWEALSAGLEPRLAARLGLEAPLGDVAAFALAGGKRLRPLLADLVGRVAGASPQARAEVGVAVEYLHGASLLLDDLACMDDARERRGAPSAHVRFSEAEAILASVALTSRGYAVLLEVPGASREARLSMAQAATRTVTAFMASGQALELKGDVGDVRDVQGIHARKTAALFTLSAELAAIAGRAAADVTERLVSLAMLFGLAYQIIDDLEDHRAPGEARANLARVAGEQDAADLARQHLAGARAGALDLGPEGALLVELVDWLGARCEAALRACSGAEPT